MAVPNLSFGDYLKEAFHAKYPIPGLGKIPINKLFLAGTSILGLANPGFWFVGAGLEMVYLWYLSTNERFHKIVQASRLNVVVKDQAEKMYALLKTLDKDSNKRLNILNANLAEINNLMDIDSDSTLQFTKETKQRALGQLPLFFLKLLVSRQLIRDSLDRTDVDKLRREVKDLTGQLGSSDLSEALAKSMKGTLDIQQKRLENIRRAQDNLRLVEMELNRIENQLQLIREEIALDRSPETLSTGIDRINATLGETEQWMDTHSEFFNRLDQSEIDTSIPTVASIPMPPQEKE